MLTKLLLIAVLCVLTGFPGFCDAGKLKIGAIFDKGDETKVRAFQLAIDEINYRRFQHEHELEAVIKNIPPQTPFKAIMATCELISEGVIAILGPSTEENSNVVQSVCDDKDIPHLDVRWDDQPMNPIINIYPYQNVLTQVYADIIRNWNYKEFIILYENNESLNRVGELFKMYDNKNKNVVVRKLDNGTDGDYRRVLKEVWRAGATHFVLDCSIEILGEVLKQAQQIGLITSQQSYFITNLDLHTLNLVDFQYAETNITGMRFIDPDSEPIRNLSSKLFSDNPDKLWRGGWAIQLETALITDAVMMFGEALRDLPNNFAPPALTCDSNDVWPFGTTLTNLMKGIKYPGLTGYIKFDNFGFRSDFGLEIVELTVGGIIKVGNWTTSEGLNISRVYPEETHVYEGGVTNRTFVVITCLTEPYGMRQESATPLFGNQRYEGFAIDLIDLLSQKLGFNYTFIIREDKKNGNYNPLTGKWDGMIGDVMEGRADLAITDLTVTSEREEVVDFTSPFMNLGVSILYQKAKKAPPSFFSFADPFALEVWKMLSAAFFVVSIAIFILGRISPAEWQNPYPCIEEPEFLVNLLSLRNCFWFMTGSIMQQGSEIAPVAVSTRMAGGMWWFFTLIMVSSYTANLAAFLTTESPDVQFADVFELVQVADEKGIKFGAKLNGATAVFFKNSTNEYYQKISQYLKDNEDDVMVGDNKDGVIKADEENYAFFMESTSIQYETQRRCNLTKVGGELDEKGYGIAMRKNSTYRGIFSQAILKLQEDGVLDDLKRKWWEERRGGGQCPEEEANSEATPLNLKNVGGVFWVTIFGSILSIVTVFIEMILHTFKRSVKTKTPFKRLLVEELKFYFAFSGMVKPVTYNSEDSGSKDGSDSTKRSFDNNTEKPSPYGFVVPPTTPLP